ncbi:MAG TPA: hypothetical protein VLF66_18900, partial [Thermoanaerobaculia bacterium]|nr:hypothetical protein [Thermoanaerobaculia bacterium]
GGSLGRAVLSDEGDGVSYLMDVHGAVLVRSVAPDRVEVLLPGNEDPEHRFWRELARLEGVLGPDGVATGTWSCAPFDIGPDAGGFEDRLYTAPGTWTLGPSPW